MHPAPEVPPPVNPLRPTPQMVAGYYHSWQWRQLRAQRRVIDCNRCQQCGASDQLTVDHIVPIVDAWNLRADLDNLVTLCHDCHRSKTRQQRRARSQRRQRRSQAARALLRDIQ
jgi:5-methylcytosine-specific restriction endonuclease McrA